jgi:hypothetical protein
MAEVSGSTGDEETPTRVEVPGGQGVQVGDRGTQDNKRLVVVKLGVITNDAHTGQPVTMTRNIAAKVSSPLLLAYLKANHREFLLGVANQQCQSR